MPATAIPQQRISFQQHVTYTCSRLLAYGLPLLFFLVTNAFYLKTYDSAQVKITFTQIGTLFLLAVWIIKMLSEAKLPFKKSDLVYVAPFIAYLISGLVAWVHTPFKAWALEETARRVFYMTIAMIAVGEMGSDERMTRLWRWLIAAALVAVGYGLVQYIDSRFFDPSQPGIDPFIWRQAFAKRVFSTFGNPNFYGNFLVIVTPLLLASVLREKGSLARPFILLAITAVIVFLLDKMFLGLFGGLDASYNVLVGGVVVVLLAMFFFYSFWKTSQSASLPLFLILFAVLFLNLYATETKGAWVGFTAALGVTVWLIFEYFLHFEQRLIEAKTYMPFVIGLGVGFTILIIAMVFAFVVPLLRGQVEQIGFQILWIPTLIAAIVAVITIVLLLKPTWNLKKMIYGVLVFFILGMGAIVLQFAKTRLVSISFRMFTWISTWEMIRTEPVLGNGVGTFKIIYPAYRRPQIIVLEARSNTETDHAEDEYLEIWQDEGIVGFGIFLWMVITALVLGFKQLRWYSKLFPDIDHKRKMLQIEGDPRSYEVLGYLGAYIGALIHWMFDVSIRFVSSGIYSGLLPGALVSYAHSHGRRLANEARLSYERWIRFGLAAFWTAVILWLKMELVPQSLVQGGDTTQGQIITWALLAGLLIWLMLELLEIGNKPSEDVPFESQYPPAEARFGWLRFTTAAVVAAGAYAAMAVFHLQFLGDVDHNMGIFFSKEAIWNKSPQYDAKMLQFPPDIRKHYEAVGGALEHYAEVSRKNPAFPMSSYFTGNVYNDWGSQQEQNAMNARARGDMEEAKRLHAEAEELWNKSEAAYNATMKLAPNYVQTHHQMGLLYLKRAESAQAWGDMAKAQQLYDEALKNFELYRMIDPVFPPNYDRIVQILMLKGKTQEAIDLIKQGIYYNDVVAREIHPEAFHDRVAAFAIQLGKIYLGLAGQEKGDAYHPPSENVKESLKYFQMAVEHEPQSVEGWKGLAFLYAKMGDTAKSHEAMARLRQLAPNDPDVQRALSPAPLPIKVPAPSKAPAPAAAPH